MSLENARNYVSEVKSALGGSTPRYKEFLSILKGYRTGEKPVTVVIEQVSQLFQGNRELTLGFNTFLPDDYKIELTSDDDEVEEDTTAEVEDKAIESSGSGKRKKSANKKSSDDVAISLPKRRLIHQIPKNRVTSATRILLSPLTSKMQPSDLLSGHDPLADKSFTAYPPQHDVFCQICKGKTTDSVATSNNNELVLLCDQKGCNAEYHLGCLPSSLVSETKPGVRTVPEGEIYCKKCAEDGATTVLEKYFDRVDYARSHYRCSRAYVVSLLANQMKANPILSGGGDYLNRPPRSELWSAFELYNQTLNDKEQVEGGTNSTRKYAGAAFLVGKPVRLYNNLDNEYHVGRICDWRVCSAYPDFCGDEPSASDDNTVSINDLEYFGTGVISTCEFLVRFPTGVNGRRKDLLKWIVLEEHSLAVGIGLIQGKPSSAKDWTPAMVLARSSLELVTVRDYLYEDENGELFAKLKQEPGKSGPCWALVSFFGEDTFELLNLYTEARDLLSNCGEYDQKSHSSGKHLDNDGPLPRHAMASITVPLALAIAERDEQERCREWNEDFLLHDPKHPLALVCADEYSSQLRLEKAGKEGKRKASFPIETGVDRMWLAQLANETPVKSKDDLMSITFSHVSSVSSAMALLQSK